MEMATFGGPARRALIATLAGLVTVTLTSCGDSDTSTTSSSSDISQLPDPPTFTGAAPSLPVNSDPNPTIRGIAPDGTTVNLYANRTCTGSPLATSSATSFASPGLTVSVSSGSTTTFHASSSNNAGTSSCSTQAIAYSYSGQETGVTCNKVASPTGSDSAAGTVAAPYLTPQHLVDSLSSGQTGCLRAGSYAQATTIEAPNLTLRSYPNERATLTGQLQTVGNGSGATIAALNFTGSPPAGGNVDIDTSDVTFRNNDVSNGHAETCIYLGLDPTARVSNTLVENNNIHDCGTLPPAGGDHGIYIDDTDGAVIRNNWIHDNVDYGLHFYPNADNSLVTGNVIDSNGGGLVFGAPPPNSSSDNNVIRHNMITYNTSEFHNVERSPNDTAPVGNVVQSNCVIAAGGSSGLDAPYGFTSLSNILVDPAYVNAASGDYHVQNSICASLLAGG
jgi:parallel beta-helix repeat protein